MKTDNVVGFESLGLSQVALNAVKRMGFERPTPIQTLAIPPALQGKDVIGCAATGTGKTAAFVLPMLARLAGKKGTRGLILAPTRELVEQIAEQLEALGHGSGLRTAVIIGGVGMGPQEAALRRGSEVIIATPGRLLDHMDRGAANLSGIELLVLDEADRMLDMGFRPQLSRILAKVPKVRQTMLFSATMAGEVATFARQYLKDPTRVEVTRSGVTAKGAAQQVFLCSQDEKMPLLLTLLAQDQDSTLVFTRTKHRADRVARQLERAGHSVSRIHGNRSQNQRRASLEGFKDGTHRILVATDIAARGIDVTDIGHVVLFDLPNVPEDYVHRVGRTARAEKTGRASSFCSPEEKELLRDIEKLTGVAVPRTAVPRDSPLFDEARKVAALKPAHTPQAQHHHHKPSHGAGRHGQSAHKGKARAGGGGHGRHTSSSSSSSGSSAGGGGGARAVTVGSWRPKRR